MGAGASGTGAAAICPSGWWKRYHPRTQLRLLSWAEGGCGHGYDWRQVGRCPASCPLAGPVLWGASLWDLRVPGESCAVHAGHSISGPDPTCVILDPSLKLPKLPPVTRNGWAVGTFFSPLSLCLWESRYMSLRLLDIIPQIMVLYLRFSRLPALCAFFWIVSITILKYTDLKDEGMRRYELVVTK